MNTPTDPARILIVDDEPTTMQLLRKALQTEGYSIDLATRGAEALEKFAVQRPDLILLDMMMPEMDGLTVLRKVREQDTTVGVIMVSALASENLVVQAMLGGADDFVTKPFSLKNLRVRIRQAIDKSRLRRENVTLQEELRIAHNKLRTLFSRYMAEPVAERLMASPTLPSLGGERQLITVLFMDFCDFTPLSHDMEPDQVVQVLNDHLRLVIQAVLAEEGTLDKFIGDGTMALFNTPIPQPDHALRAVRSAVAMRDAIIEWAQDHHPALRIRIGVHTGEAVVGNIGAQEFMNYTAIGDTVNLAKRLQENAADNSVVISKETLELLPECVQYTPLGQWTVKGRQTPVEVYRIDDILDPSGTCQIERNQTQRGEARELRAQEPAPAFPEDEGNGQRGEDAPTLPGIPPN